MALSQLKYIPLSELAIRQQLQLAQPINFHLFSSIDSTNRFLKKYPSSANIEVCCAETQTQGRGRFGRTWHSPFGENIYCSSRWRLPCEATKLAGLSLIVSLAIMATLDDFEIADNIYVKWPNDLVWQGQKLSGILLELITEAGRETDIIIGIGINVNSPPQAVEIDKPWCSLFQITGKTFDRNLLIAQLIQNLQHYLHEFIEQGLTAFLTRWERYDYLQGKTIAVSHLGRQLTGQYLGIDEEGQLLLNQDGMTHHLSAGDTSIIPAEAGIRLK